MWKTSQCDVDLLEELAAEDNSFPTTTRHRSSQSIRPLTVNRHYKGALVERLAIGPRPFKGLSRCDLRPSPGSGTGAPLIKHFVFLATRRGFEQAYKPRVLRNWEVPKRYNDKPKRRTGRTEVISNDRGHLLPGVPKSKSSPWGSFMGTWHFPKKIDRKTADELNGTVKNPTCEEKRQAKELRQKLEQIVEENEKKVEQVEATEGEVAQEAQENQIEEVEEAPFCPIHGYLPD
ncbi:hypothetical protein MTP99_011496 [Tenebrio molitor]|nr:hypothetical protein MTP99_011496 [Tenebrio molitor]